MCKVLHFPGFVCVELGHSVDRRSQPSAWPPTARERPIRRKQFNLHRLGLAGQIANRVLQRSHEFGPHSEFRAFQQNVSTIRPFHRRRGRFCPSSQTHGPESVRRLPYWVCLIIRVRSHLLASAASKGLYPEVSAGESLANHLLSYQRPIWSQITNKTAKRIASSPKGKFHVGSQRYQDYATR
jgi:hypothetical protein